MRPRLIATRIVLIWRGECVFFKAKDRHDTDGGLSLELREASGRPRQCRRVAHR